MQVNVVVSSVTYACVAHCALCVCLCNVVVVQLGCCVCVRACLLPCNVDVQWPTVLLKLIMCVHAGFALTVCGVCVCCDVWRW